MILEKPILFFVPDLEEYVNDVGTFVDIEKLGCPVCQSEQSIVDCIKHDSFDIQQIKKLKNQFFDIPDENSTQRVVDFIINILSKDE